MMPGSVEQGQVLVASAVQALNIDHASSNNIFVYPSPEHELSVR